MKEIRVYVVDGSLDAAMDVKRYFSKHAVINLKECETNGQKALEHLLNHHHDYDLLIMDLICPGKDGLSILNELSEHGICMKTIITSSINSAEVITRCMNAGVNYYMLKPYSYEDLENHIIEIVSNDNKNVIISSKELRKEISDMLHILGMPSNIKGYNYIRESIDLMYNNPKMMGAITKELYPEIAQRYDTTPSRVERAIRHAIGVSCDRGNPDVLEEIFGHSIGYYRDKPTNSEFIATLTDKIRLERLV